MTVTTQDRAEAPGETAPLVVVSCDTHIGPRLVEDLRPYCPNDLLEDFDAIINAREEARRAAEASGKTVGFGNIAMGDDWGITFANKNTPGHHDMHARLRDLDTDGVAAEVMFHDSQNGEPMPFQGEDMRVAGMVPSAEQLKLMRAGQQIYNRWLADVCSIEPERHIGLMHLPMWDIEAALEDLVWARELGLKGLNFPAPRSWITPYNDPAWESFFSACEDLGVTLCNHGGAGGTSGGFGPGSLSVMKYEISMMTRICPMDLLVFGGVFERHPRLRLVTTESPGNWWRFVLQEMDSIYMTDRISYGPTEFNRLPKLPSEYASRQVWIGASFHANFEAVDAIENGFADRVIWGSDYPHFEGTYQYDTKGPNGEPMTWAAQRCTYAGIPESDVRRMIGGNAMDAYDLDYAALTKVAQRINAPSYEDLQAASVTERPKGGGHLAFRHFGFWH